jgi:hypothetical protein
MHQFEQGEVFSQRVQLMKIAIDQLQPIEQANYLPQDGPRSFAHSRVINVPDG